MSPTHDPLELMRRYVDGQATTEETRALEALLREDPEFRQSFLRYTHLDAALGSARLSTSMASLPEALPSKPAKLRRPQWSPLFSAAAGLMIGMLCTSVVWAYALPSARPGQPQILPLFLESFEDTHWQPKRGFPSSSGEWFGDLSRSLTAENGVSPTEGDHMVRLAPHPTRKFSYAARIVDLEDHPLPFGAVSRQIDVTASFHGANLAVKQRHQIRLAAFGEAPDEIRALWNSPDMFDYVLQHVGRTVPMKPGEEGWRTIEAAMEIPPGTRSLVIWVAAGGIDDSSAITTHYLDDVQARFVIEEASE